MNIKTRNKTQTLTAYAFLSPAIVVIGLFVVHPAIKLFYTSFTSVDLIGGNDDFIGLLNYIDLMNDPSFRRSFMATIGFMLLTVPVQTIVALFMAIQVNKSIKGIGLFRTVYFLPVVTSFMAIAYLWKFMLNSNFGFINECISYFGVQRVNFLANVDTALYSVAFTCVWKSWAFFMMIFLAGLKEIPTSIYESAAIDGVNSWQKFLFITLPLLKKTTLFVVMITTMDSVVKVFVPVYAMTQGGPRDSTNILVHYVWRQAFRMNEVGYASAAAVIMFIFVLILSVVQYRLGNEN